MKDKQLKEQAIKIKGKDYVLVADRVLFFNEQYKNGCIETKLLSPVDSELIVMQAMVTPDADKPGRVFTGYSQERVGDGMINKTSALENAETSAVGRALAMMGIGVIESIASVDEINKADNQRKPMAYATVKQIDWMRAEARKISGFEEQSDIDQWITSVLTIPPHKVPVFKVKSAVEVIQTKKELQPDVDTSDISDEEIGKGIDDFNDGKLPY